MEDSREEALERMMADAEALGANAVVSVRIATSVVMSGAAEMLAYGTAVTIEDE
ncbi:MAG: heavy metal-binding domain-containing protein [Bacteroidota bacterium]